MVAIVVMCAFSALLGYYIWVLLNLDSHPNARPTPGFHGAHPDRHAILDFGRSRPLVTDEPGATPPLLRKLPPSRPMADIKLPPKVPSFKAPPLATLPPAPVAKAGSEHHHRIAILVPYLGTSWPKYFPLFYESCQRSESLIDWLIFHDGVAEPEWVHSSKTDNVFFINLQHNGIATLFGERLALGSNVHNTDNFVADFQAVFTKFPRMVAEYKPVLGHVFEHYTADYSHWGYADMDMMMGDMPSFLPSSELDEFDIITFTQGDGRRLYLRGQFTIFKNNADTRTMYEECPWMSSQLHTQLEKKKGAKFHFNSAEGCISIVALDGNFKTKWTERGYSDVIEFENAREFKHHLPKFEVSNGRVFKCDHNERIKPLRVDPEDPQCRLEFLEPEELELSPSITPISEFITVEDDGCNNYWLGPKKYSRCLTFAAELLATMKAKAFYHKADLITHQGKFFQQTYKRKFHRDEYHDCEESGFFHFQGMKKNKAFAVPESIHDGFRCQVYEVHTTVDAKKKHKTYNLVHLIKDGQ